MSAQPHHHFTLAEYMRLVEHVRDVKLEYVDGAVVAMAGGSPRHNFLCNRIGGMLDRALAEGPCRALNSDQGVSTADGLYTYADVTVVCGALVLAPGSQHVTNPSVQVEVLSKGTREYDEGEKLERYKTIPSVRDVVLVEQETVAVVHHFRTVDGWASRRLEGEDTVVALTGVAVEMRLGDVYRGAFDLPSS